MHHFLVGVFSRQISLCRNFHSKVGVGVISDGGVISVEYGTCNLKCIVIVKAISEPQSSSFSIINYSKLSSKLGYKTLSVLEQLDTL